MMGIENEEIRESPQGMLPIYKEQNYAILIKKTTIIWRGPKKTGLIK